MRDQLQNGRAWDPSGNEPRPDQETDDSEDIPPELAARLVRALDRLPSSIACLIEPDLTIRWLSHSAEWVTGSDPKGRNGDDSLARIHPEDAGQLLHGLTQIRSIAQSDGDRMVVPGPLRYRFQRLDDDRWMVMEAQVHPLEGDPLVNGMLVIARPVDGPLDGVGHVIDLLVADEPLADVLTACAQMIPTEAASGAVVGLVGGDVVVGVDPDGPAAALVEDERWWRWTLHQGAERVSADFAGFPPDLAETARAEGFRTVWTWPLRDRSEGDVLGSLVVWVRFAGEYNIAQDMVMRQVERVAGMVLAEQRRIHALRREAMTDNLTGLANRSALRNCLDTAPDPVTVAVLDLDDFKPINDQHGHETGDAVLRAMAQRLVRAVRDSDLVARLGGDEVVIVFAAGTPPEVCVEITDRVLATISDPIHLEGDLTLAVTASAGLATGPPTEALHEADARLYQAKKAKSRRR